MTPVGTEELFEGDPAAALEAALTSSAGRARLVEECAVARSRKAPELDLVLDAAAARGAAGDQAALLVILEVTHHLALARPAVASVLFDPSAIDDVLQATLMTVERRLGSYEGRAKFRTWLHTVARNEALMAIRRHTDQPVDQLPEPGGTAPRLSSVVAGRMRIEALVAALPPPYAETLTLQLFDDLDYEAIAARLDVPIGTVRSRLAKGKELLREAIAAQQQPARH